MDDARREYNESALLLDNGPVFRNVTPMDHLSINRSGNESMVEAIRSNKPLYRQATEGRETNESQLIPPSSNHPLFKSAPKDGEAEAEDNQSMMEPIRTNSPYFAEEGKLGEVEAQKSMIEPA